MTPEDRIKTPCIRACNWLDDKGICSGCYRDLKQIEKWSSYTDEEKEVQLKLIKQRKLEVLK